jgi:hypothetical protein
MGVRKSRVAGISHLNVIFFADSDGQIALETQLPFLLVKSNRLQNVFLTQSQCVLNFFFNLGSNTYTLPNRTVGMLPWPRFLGIPSSVS